MNRRNLTTLTGALALLGGFLVNSAAVRPVDTQDSEQVSKLLS